MRIGVPLLLLLCAGCDAGLAGEPDGGPLVDGGTAADGGAATGDADAPDAGAPDGAPAQDSLSELRARLFSDYAGGDVCAAWNELDASQRAVFATLTHRLYISQTPDGLSMLDHITALYLVLGGGPTGDACGDSENNRLFLSMDDTLWNLMVDTWYGDREIGDGGGTLWDHTHDLAGPHDPFDASDESEAGLSCALIIELPDSRPPTAQAQFFLPGSAVPVDRGSGIQLDADPRMLEIDHDFDCFHQSNPLCPGRGFDDAYREHYGDFGCDWIPPGCVPDGDGCYRGVR